MPRGGRPSALVVLLHGYGANGDDLIALGDGWRRALPDAAFVAPNAPKRSPACTAACSGLRSRCVIPASTGAGWRPPGRLLDRFLDAELARYRLGAERLVLVGFSQGTMMALHVGLRRAAAPAGIVAYSGLLAGPEHLGETKARPPVLLVHGEADDVIPVDALHMAREALAGAGVPVEWHVRPGLGHGIDPEAQWMAGHFIAQALRGVRGPSSPP